VKLIPACGFESVPFDLGVLGLDSAFREVDGSRLREAEAEARFIFHSSPLRYGHGTSGGTLATVARLIEFGDLTDSRSFARVAEPLEIAQPIGLEARRSRDGEWLGPLMPTPFLNPAVMALSSQRLEEGPGGYAPGFRYRESLNLSASLGSSLLGKVAAKGSSALARRLDAMPRRQQTPSDRFILAALDALAPAAGLGPRRSALDSIDYEIELRASSSSGLHGKGKVHGKGHPGYRSAANILAETGIGLACDETLPERYGVQTPASALGWGFADSLASAGLHFEIEVGDAVQA